MFHHEHSATIGVACIHSATIFVVGVVLVRSGVLFVVGIVRVVRELSACGGRFPYLLSALFFVVAEFSAIPAFGCVLATRTGVEAPPSCEGSSLAPVLWSILGVVVGRTSAALSLAESASRSSASSSSVRVRVEHVAFRLIAPCTHVVFFDQQHRLELEEGGGFLPCKNGGSHRAEPWCEAAEAYLHHLIVIDVYAYRAERVAELLDLYGVCRDGHVPLLNVVQLLAELKPSCGCICRENLV